MNGLILRCAQGVCDSVWNDDPAPMSQTEWAHMSLAILAAFGLFVFGCLCYAWWKSRMVREYENMSGAKADLTIQRLPREN